MNIKKIRRPSRKADKLIKGIIIGGAIGSVLGVTLAPKSGKETRSIIKEGSQKIIQHIPTPTMPNFSAPKKKVEKKRGLLSKVSGAFKALVFGKKS